MATRDERLSFVVTLAGSAAVSVLGSMRGKETVATMGGAPE